MNQARDRKNERMFTIELKSKGDLNIVSLEGNKKVLIEGSIGSLERAQFLEGLVLEVIGSNGELRIDLDRSDLERSIRSDESKNERRNEQ
jgi:hypothetical protein